MLLNDIISFCSPLYTTCSRFTVNIPGRCLSLAWTLAVLQGSMLKAKTTLNPCAQLFRRFVNIFYLQTIWLALNSIKGYKFRNQHRFTAVLVCHFLPKALSASAETYPMFIFAKEKSREEEGGSTATNNITFIQRKQEHASQEDTDSSTDEFVLL